MNNNGENVVDKIYDLIKEDSSPNIFYNNLDLFEHFYRREMDLIYGSPKILDIYKYLVTIDVDPERFPTLKQNIFSDFQRYAQMYTYKFYDKKKSEDPELQIEGLFNLIDLFSYFKQFDKENRMYDDITFFRDCTGSMILSLNKDFFNLSTETIKKLMSVIKNNSYLKYLINHQQMNRLLDKDYIFQYVDKFLASKVFVSLDSLKDDELLKALFEGKIKNEAIVEYIFKHINTTVLLQFVSNDFSKIADLFDSINLDKVKRKIIFNKFLDNKAYDDNDVYLINFLASDERAKFYIDDEQEKNLINKFTLTNYYPSHNDIAINYLMDKCNSTLFNLNLLENLKKNNWSQETICRINERTSKLSKKQYSYEEAITVLDNIFKGNYEKNDSNLLKDMKAIRAIACNFLGDDNVPVYFFSEKKEKVCGAEEDYTVRYNLEYISKLFDYKEEKSNPDKLHILATLFHECRHYQQFKNAESENINEYGYKTALEELLGNLLSDYYKDNYVSVFYEQDARVVGSFMAAKFLKENFPYLSKAIDHFIKEAKDEDKEKFETREIFSDTVSVEDAISKLIMVNPSIVKSHSFLQKGYNLDGTRKSKNNILN